jgi:anaerobic selenocysteine-containing dehydrogenase
MPTDVMEEVQQLLDTAELWQPNPGPGFTHLLIARRTNQVMNSTGSTFATTLNRVPYNPAYMNPDDLAEMDLEAGDLVTITSRHGSMTAIVQPDKTLRRSLVSISHLWGGLPGNPGPGSNVNLLISCDTEVQGINAMPRMSAIPVNIVKVETDPSAQESLAAVVSSS